MTSVSAGADSRGVAFVNLGCGVNRVELDAMAEVVLKAGGSVVDEHDARVIVINTCAVTGEAQAKTRKAVSRAMAMPQSPVIIATGCVANLFADELRSLSPELIIEPDKANVARRACALAGLDPDAAPVSVELETTTPTGRTRPGIKVQDGCDNRCTYCIVWKARGSARSLDAAYVEREVMGAIAHGAREVVLTGINLGRYDGRDERGASLTLCGLLERLLENTNVGRIRLSSTEPQDIDRELLELMGASGGRIAPFLHVPLQSGSDSVLRRMARRYRADEFLQRMSLAKELVPGIALGTDLIVGFPGETDEEFADSLAVCRQSGFSRMHVFRYSKRPGTPAAVMEGQVDPRVMARRSRDARQLALSMREDYVRSRVGEEELVLVERPGGGSSGGLVDVLVRDDVEVGSLVPVVAHGVIGGVTLDAR